ncbi:type I-F CRISPR-associated protein Csy2 [Methylomonas rivi]|uniref:Type I-F CRISPR-associated protein Csy2 n=1 Tax=Methylomonas rivi TaxID=2952226 RepID=A0ABT1U8X0_9GAMM|nr:type I-F CRISPR-associated protein Csy2 [Methylomonas sp. WSC-6]MCQ8130303.1 type I-F CRISPR-associated protein Csy2 [Methylomonas sp. WSC-6]
MSHYILINRVQVQSANAIAGFTWGFPAITHFLGFTHNLTRKLLNRNGFNGINLNGCAVISHNQQIHTYKPYDYQFTQSRNPPYLKSHDKTATPPVIEEGKMNMVVSLLIGYEGNLGNRQDEFIKWLKNACMLQRLAGGTILDINDIEVFSTDDLRTIKRKLLPGFVLMDRSNYLESHYQALLNENSNAELLDAWMDFITIKQRARPKSDLITNHLAALVKNEPENEYCARLSSCWDLHQEHAYDETKEPDALLKNYFDQLESNKNNRKLLDQWQSYCKPTEATESDWEYITKPEAGYLVPLMVGYKAISEVYQNSVVENTRDHETPVCFVESVHSVGEWLGIHRLRTVDDLNNSLWFYHYENNWYLCKQNRQQENDEPILEHIINYEDPEDDFN